LELGLIVRCVSEARVAARNARIVVAIGMLGVSILLGLATAFLPDAMRTPRMVVVATTLLIVVSQAFSVMNYFVFPDRAIERFVGGRRTRALRAHARELGVETAISNYQIDWRTGQAILIAR
jgi:hypothetical protein